MPRATRTRRAELGWWLLQAFLPPSPALQNGLKFLRCSQIYVGLVNASGKGQGKQKGRSDSNYLMH